HSEHTVTLNAPPPVPGYALALPTPGDALAFLARAVGPDAAAGEWIRACAQARAPSADLSVDEMMRASEELAKREGVVGVIGKSLVVRIRTYRLLAGNAARGKGGR
ncbi:MAG TPA: hypothetical protein VK358_16280, partial [Longimicrobium sp.]|nr:hypothetical protein [Longimicrobium sp.]